MCMKRSKIMMCDGGVGSRWPAPIGMDSRAGDPVAVKGGRGINTAISRLSCLPLSSASASASALALAVVRF
jgi:hypothetical protein